MKIAVQLFGHVRTFRECSPYLKRYLLDLYDCDVFLHTWDQENHSNPTWHSQEVNSDIGKTDEALLCDCYSPVSYQIEKQKNFDVEGFYGTDANSTISLKGIKSMLYSTFQVNELRLAYQEKTNQHYDYIIMLRPDVLLLAPLKIESYLSDFEFSDKTSIHFSMSQKNKYFDQRFVDIHYANDLFYFAQSCVMDKIAAAYKEFQHYYIDIVKSLPKGLSIPEMSFETYCLNSGVIPHYYKHYYLIKRDNNQKNLCSVPSLIEADKLNIDIPKHLMRKKKWYKRASNYIKFFIYKMSK